MGLRFGVFGLLSSRCEGLRIPLLGRTGLRFNRRLACILGALLVVVVGTAVPALAVVSGPCDGSAQWQGADPPLTVVASTAEGLIEIPLEGTVIWTGSIDIPPPSESRDASGHVKVKLPFPIGLVQVGAWSTSGTLIENSGTYTYDFPALLSGFEVTVEGKHWEGTLTPSGPPTCSGTATLALEGTNPIGFIAGGLTIVTIMGTYLAVRVKGPAAGGRRT